MLHVRLHRKLAAVALAASLGVTTGATGAQGDAVIGGCYPKGQVPALSSRTRVFVVTSLETESTAPDGHRTVTTIARPSVVIARATSGTDDLTIIPGARPLTMRAKTQICAYPPDVSLPAGFTGVAPDFVIP